MTPCRTCGKAIAWRSRRSAWIHASGGADHPPMPPTLARGDVTSRPRLAFGEDRMPADEAETAPAWPPLGER